MFFEVPSMKSGVQSVTIKLKDSEDKDSLRELLENPGAFHEVTYEGEPEIAIGERKFLIAESEGEGTIGPWTSIDLRIDANEIPIELLISLDTSYSMISSFEETTRYDLAIEGINSLLAGKSSKLIAGIMAYGVVWEMTMDMTNVKNITKKKLNGIVQELSDIKHKGKAAAGTALNGALEVFTVKGLNDIRVVVLLTDGTDEIGPNPLKEAEKLVSRGIYIYPFYFGEESDQKSLTILERIANMSHTKLFKLYEAVEEEKRRLIRESLKSPEGEGKPDEVTLHDDEIQTAEPVEDEVNSETRDSEEGSTDSDDQADERSEHITDPSDDDQASDMNHDSPTDDFEGKGTGEELNVPSGSDLLMRELTQLGTYLTLQIQEGSKELPMEEDKDVEVIRAGIPVEEEEKQEKEKERTFRRTPKIIDAIKNFIDWVKSLIW